MSILDPRAYPHDCTCGFTVHSTKSGHDATCPLASSPDAIRAQLPCLKCGLPEHEHGDFGFRDHAYAPYRKDEICQQCGVVRPCDVHDQPDAIRARHCWCDRSRAAGGGQCEPCQLRALLVESDAIRQERDMYRDAFACCEVHTPDLWEGDGTCVICEAVELDDRLKALRASLTALAATWREDAQHSEATEESGVGLREHDLGMAEAYRECADELDAATSLGTPHAEPEK